MSFGQFPSPSRHTDEAEKPFWISYADLMTALMILFLVIMVTALASITKKKDEVIIEGKTIDRKTPTTEVRVEEIASICDYLSEKVSEATKGAFVDCKLNRINFGEVGRFDTNGYVLSPEGEKTLNEVVPVILNTANTPLGKKWLKQVLIEGSTDTDGSYLYNLNLSLKRSESVMCTLLRNDKVSESSLTADQRRQVKKLFLAGGVAFNNIRDSKDASRRVELKLQFYGLDKAEAKPAAYEAKFDDDVKEKCYL
jgi:outer membrane protein OmpA-like peptidoglycan-associated protein